MSAEKFSISKEIVTSHQATGVAHSKLILVGEHAVVHGQPAIAIPFPLIGVESVVEERVGELYLESALYEGPLEKAPKALTGLVETVKETLSVLGIAPRNLLIRITSSIPPGKGLGSSASVAIAIVKSLFQYAGEKYTHEQLLHFAGISETYAHGSPSGIDSLTITSESPIWYEKGQEPSPIIPHGAFHFVVADTGQMADTKSAIETVTDMLKSAPDIAKRKIERIGEFAHHVRAALENSSVELLGPLLNEVQIELRALGVSNQALDRLVDYAREEGALGAKLTGGGNGGCIIALARDGFHAKQLAKKLKQFGAEAVWPFVLGESNQGK